MTVRVGNGSITLINFREKPEHIILDESVTSGNSGSNSDGSDGRVDNSVSFNNVSQNASGSTYGGSVFDVLTSATPATMARLSFKTQKTKSSTS